MWRATFSTTSLAKPGYAPGGSCVEEPSVIPSEQFFDLTPEIIAALNNWKRQRGFSDSSEEEHHAYLLDPGLGPATYLTADGRVLWLDDGWDVKATRAAVYVAIRVGAAKTKVPQLLSLLPKAPPDAAPCGECDGTGLYSAHGALKAGRLPPSMPSPANDRFPFCKTPSMQARLTSSRATTGPRRRGVRRGSPPVPQRIRFGRLQRVHHPGSLSDNRIR